jgi:hypothetical protein
LPIQKVNNSHEGCAPPKGGVHLQQRKEKKIMYQLSITAGGHSKIVNLDTKDEINQFVNTTNMVSDVKIVELDSSGARELTREEILDIVLL